VADSGGVVMVPAFSGLAAPHWQGRARACFAGMSLNTRREHLVRAALEGIAFRVQDILLAMGEAGVRPAALGVDGGLSRSDFLMQVQADLLGIPVHRQDTAELTAVGVALMAGLGAGVWKSIAQLPAAGGPARVFLPDAARTRRHAAGYERWSRFCREVARWGETGLTG
jgi:glycerol kinase